jgi:hypothetical protein
VLVNQQFMGVLNFLGIIKLGALSSLLNVEKMKLKAAIQEDLINSGFE